MEGQMTLSICFHQVNISKMTFQNLCLWQILCNIWLMQLYARYPMQIIWHMTPLFLINNWRKIQLLNALSYLPWVRWIITGYGTMRLHIIVQIKKTNHKSPQLTDNYLTHHYHQKIIKACLNWLKWSEFQQNSLELPGQQLLNTSNLNCFL